MKYANKRFNSGHNEFEITFDSSASISTVTEEAVLSVIPRVSLHPVADIRTLEHTVVDEIVDVIGVVVNIDGPKTILTKRGEHTKTDITLADSSPCSVMLCVWQEKAAVLKTVQVGDVLAAKAVRVSHFNRTPSPPSIRN